MKKTSVFKKPKFEKGDFVTIKATKELACVASSFLEVNGDFTPTSTPGVFLVRSQTVKVLIKDKEGRFGWAFHSHLKAARPTMAQLKKWGI